MIEASGSNTTYTMMQQLSDLYNSVPGCDQLTAIGTQELDFSCPIDPNSPPPGGENGYTLAFPSPNPENSVVFQMPAYGSGNGIKQLEFSGNDTTSATIGQVGGGTVDLLPMFARSSRAANTASGGDNQGMNFVAYAEDAVPWFHYTQVNGTNTPSSAVTDLSVSQLQGIYEGTITDWGTVGGTSGDPIDVFMAQSGSGTEATWVSGLTLTGSFPYGGVSATSTRTGKPAKDYEIFENEVSQIFATGEESNAIFFFSFGKYSLLCPSGHCAGVPATDGAGVTIVPTTTTAALGTINGIAASKTTIQNGTFPLDRQLYNVYSDGSNPNLPGAAPSSVLAFISTYGFLCSANTAKEHDPLSPTGANYLSEIDSILTKNGFFPIPLGTMGDASIPTPPSFPASRTATASTTSGSTTLTLTSGSFTAQDIGKQVTGTGIAAGTSLVSISSSTTAVMSKAATATGTPTATISAARSVTDAATTSGSKVLTSATAKFTVADVGDVVQGPGIPLAGLGPNTITKVVSTTTVDIKVAATATQTGATVWFGYGNDYVNADLPPTNDQGYCRVTTTDGDGNG